MEAEQQTETNKEYQLVKGSTYGHGYDYNKTEPEKRMIKIPDSSLERLVIIDNESFLVTTLLENLKMVLSFRIDNKTITAEYEQSCLENLRLIDTNLFFVDYFLTPYESLFKGLIRSVIYQTAFSIWDKERNEYAQEIEFYQTKDNPAPACGENKDRFTCNGKEFYSIVTLMY